MNLVNKADEIPLYANNKRKQLSGLVIENPCHLTAHNNVGIGKCLLIKTTKLVSLQKPKLENQQLQQPCLTKKV